MEWKGVFDVADSDALTLDEDAHDVESVGVVRAAMARDPDARRTSQLFLLSPVDGFNRTAEAIAAPSLDLDERYHPVPLDHEIDVPVAAPEAPLHHTPPPQAKPSLRNPLPQIAECLPGR